MSADETSRTLWKRLHDNLGQLDAARSEKLDPAALSRKLAKRAATLRHRTRGTEAPVDMCNFVAFHNDRHRYGISLNEIREITALEPFAPVPHAPNFIAGVTHWRGSILAILDLDHFLDLPEPGLADLHACLIVEAAGVRMAVVAGEVEDIFSVPVAELQAAPTLPGETAPAWIAGVHRQDRLILSMDALVRDPRLVDFRRYRTSGVSAPSGIQREGAK